MIIVNSKFDGGSIIPVDLSNPEKLNSKLNITFSELSKTAYPDGWKDYNICASYDNEYWFRLATNFDGDNLTFQVTPGVNTIYFAYFEPYSYAEHMKLIGFANQSEL